MAKRKIDAKQLVADIHAGVGDEALIEKYDVPPGKLCSHTASYL